MSKNPRKGDESHTINSSVAANGVLRIIAACFRITAALLAGEPFGNVLQDGNNIYVKAPRTKSSAAAPIASSVILI